VIYFVETQRTKRRECNVFGDVVSCDLMHGIEKKMANSHCKDNL